MKKAATIFVLLALTLLMTVSVSALQVSVPTIGDDRQDREKNISTTFTVTNNGTTTLNGITFTHTAATKFNIRFSPTVLNLSVGEESPPVTITGDIPTDFNAVESNKAASDYLKEKAFIIGQLTASASGQSATADIKMQAVNQLEIKKATLECSARGETSAIGSVRKSVDDGDRVKDLKPDMACSVRVEVENNFPEDDDEDELGNDKRIGDIEFDTADVTVEIDDRDFDVDEEENADGLGANDEDEVNVDFDIDEDVSDGTYKMLIFLEGRDENNAIHGEKFEIRLEVDRLNHDVQIRSLGVNPDTISACTGSTITLNANVLNLGKRDEDEVAYELSIPELNIKQREELFSELEEDDSIGVSIIASVPANTRAGVYRGSFTTFFDRIAPSNTRAVEIVVEKCEDDEPVVTTEPTQTGTQTQPTQTTTQPAQTTGAAGVAVPRTRVTSSGFAASSGYLWLIGGLSVVMLVIILALLAVAFRRPKQPQF